MTFYELIAKHNWEDIRAILLLLYPDEEKNLVGYGEAFIELRNTAPTSSDMAIHIEREGEPEGVDGDSYEDVFALKFDDKERYALDFVVWAQVLAMPISKKTLREYTELEIVSHLLFELTFYGYSSEAVKEKRSKLDEAMARVLREIES